MSETEEIPVLVLFNSDHDSGDYTFSVVTDAEFLRVEISVAFVGARSTTTTLLDKNEVLRLRDALSTWLELEEDVMYECPNCGAMMNAGEACPECDHDNSDIDCSCQFCTEERGEDADAS